MQSVLFALLCALPIFASAADYLEGRVVKIADGDTLTLLTDEKKQVRIRLSAIDAPEKGQPWGRKARQALADKVGAKEIRVRVVTTDRYGRKVGVVNYNGEDINRMLVLEGHAWVYRRYSRDPSLLDDERTAREASRGLWSLHENERIPPWEWRKQQRER